MGFIFTSILCDYETRAFYSWCLSGVIYLETAAPAKLTLTTLRISRLITHFRSVPPTSCSPLTFTYRQGLLDFAFSPLFGQNDYFYVSYTCDLNDGVSRCNRRLGLNVRNTLLSVCKCSESVAALRCCRGVLLCIPCNRSSTETTACLTHLVLKLQAFPEHSFVRLSTLVGLSKGRQSR